MAKAKKNSELSLEEKLEQALVPVEEQPYEVPENWCWTKIKYGFDVTSSKRIHKSDWLSEGVPFYRTRELVKLSNDGYVDNELFISEELYKSLIDDFGKPEKEDILVSGVGTIGVPYVVDGTKDFYFKDGNVIWFKNKKIFNAKYVYYLYKSLFMKNQIYGKSAGTTVDTYTIVNANETILPLPPLAEQQRIVEQIESLFAKLDEAKEKAESVVELFQLHKDAILHKAFMGEYTEKWRAEKQISKESWRTIKLEELLKPMQSRQPQGEWFRYIDIDAIDNKRQVIREAKKIPTSEAPSRASRAVEEDAILFSMVRPYLKNIAYVDKEMADCIASTGFYVCRCKEGLDSRFLYEFLRSKDAIDYLMQFMKGDNSPSIRKDDLLGMIINLPTYEEQQRIVFLLNNLLLKEEQAKDKACEVIDSIDLLKKAILAKAFRGELGTNNPEEESALELLKSILAEK